VTHKFAKFLILAAGALGLSALPALADQACSTYNGSDNGATYFTTGFSCYIGDLDFSDFTYSSSASGGATAVPAGDVTVSPVTTATGVGFLFNASWNATMPNETSDGIIGFDVSIVGGGPAEIEDAALLQTGSIDGTNTGSIDSVGEDGCSPSNTCTLQQWALVTSQTSDTVNTADHIFITPTGSISVSKDINAASGSGAGAFAEISGVEDTFSVVPEPRDVALFVGFGLLAAIMLKRKLSVQN
jgi:hypothetical protein